MLREWHDASASRGARQPWKRARRIALWRLPRCRCGLPATDVHHKVPLVEGGSVLDQANLEPLCSRCHAIEPGKLHKRRQRQGWEPRPPRPGPRRVWPGRARRRPAQHPRERRPARPHFLEPRVGASRFLGRLRRDFGRNARSRPLNPNTSSPPRTARRRLERRRASVLEHTLSRTRKRARRPACVCVF
jgi:HNH endonuclease